MVTFYRLRRSLRHKLQFVSCVFALPFSIYVLINYTINARKLSLCSLSESVDVVYTWVNGSDPELIKNIKYYLSQRNKGTEEDELIDFSNQRYSDKNELRFSLRSLEKYAPWINHVYIVTNGQIPSWLNLEYDKVSIVTHEEIFTDLKNLPSFSSPAIERNLHRIPGLTKKFIYFNDDVFLGKPMFLEDFYNRGLGYLLHFAQNVPQCNRACHWIYINDGVCDLQCFVEKCQWDGGDCDTVIPRSSNASDSLFDNYVKEYYEENEDSEEEYQSVDYHNESVTVSARKLTSFNKNPLFDLIKKNITNLGKVVNQYNVNVMYTNKNKRFNKKVIKDPKSDVYSESLQHTNRIFNEKFDFKPRKVPHHMPILIDKDIAADMQEKFKKEFALTEKNRFRAENDMQFSFSYYHFVMEENVQRTIDDVFDEFDTDKSGTWADREIRTILTKLFKLPLTVQSVQEFENMLLECAELQNEEQNVPVPQEERYSDSILPTITKRLVLECKVVTEIIMAKFKYRHKYQFKPTPTDSNMIAFKMLISNASDVVYHLDDIRKNLRKFICLNDNLDDSKKHENEIIKALLFDFYTYLFPKPSKFELPANQINHYLHMKELKDWQRQHDTLKLCVICAIVFILLFLFYKCVSTKKKCSQMSVDGKIHV